MATGSVSFISAGAGYSFFSSCFWALDLISAFLVGSSFLGYCLISFGACSSSFF
jgi:hypothetical protein